MMNIFKYNSFTYQFSRTPLAWLITSQVAVLMGLSGVAQAQDYFNPSLLEIDRPAQRGADLSVFEDGKTQAPGKYRVDMYLNEEKVDTREIDFKLIKDSRGEDKLEPCLSSGMLESFGVRVDAFPDIKKAGGTCIDIEKFIPQASSTFHFSQLRLDLSIPQAALNIQARGYVSPDKWDSGIPALLVDYSFSGSSDKSRSGGAGESDSDSTSNYLNLRSGVNLGAWRLRNYSTWSRDSRGTDHWNSINSYLQRDVVPLKSQMTLGDSTSPSEVFDSVPFRGVQLASDDDMLPDSMKGFSPVVRGIAKSNAQVTIRQNGYVIYQSYVPPGPFEIKDLYPTAGSGDLNVTIKEVDGSEQNIVIPFASVPVLQREGRFKYSLTSGQYRTSYSSAEKTPFTQATAIYGLSWGATLYGGMQAASKYQSIALGWGQNMGRIGALSADVTQAWSKPEDQAKDNGQSWRVRYGKSFAETGTSFSLASYRYSTDGFYSLQEALDTYDGIDESTRQSHKKSRAELTLSQSLWAGAGALSLSMVQDTYWNDNRESESVNFGYNNYWNSISYGMYYTYTKNGYDTTAQRVRSNDHILAFNISVPLSKWLPGSYVSYSVNSSRNGNTTNRVALSGTALEGHNLNYNVSQGYTSQGQGASGSSNISYRGGLGQASVGYGYDNDSQRITYALEGGVMVHENGITLSQPLGETVALVKAPGAANVRIQNEPGVTTDWRGYAVVPYETPYRRNDITLDTSTLADDVDMTLTSKTVIPTRGAVVLAEFKPSIGQRVLMTLRRSNGEAVPFGATVSSGSNDSIVADGGQVYLTGLSDSGKLNVKWGNGEAQQCSVTYTLPIRADNISINAVNGKCI
jgi:outer membrane usher protein